MSNQTFNTLRFIEQLILPIATFISAISEIFGFAWGVEVAAALGAVNILMGAVIEAARNSYNAKIESGEIPKE